MLTAATGLAPIERVREAQRAIMASGHAVMPPAVHSFAPGVYVRGLPMTAGLLVIGRQHKTAHLLQVISGTVLIDNGDGPVEVTGLATLHTEPGTKRAIFAVTDAYLQTIHVTDETDLAVLEQVLLEPEPEMPCLELPR
jgi:hypothetical protein